MLERMENDGSQDPGSLSSLERMLSVESSTKATLKVLVLGSGLPKTLSQNL